METIKRAVISVLEEWKFLLVLAVIIHGINTLNRTLNIRLDVINQSLSYLGDQIGDINVPSAIEIYDLGNIDASISGLEQALIDIETAIKNLH